MTEEATPDTRSEIRKELELWLTRNAELENIMKSKGVGLNPMTFLTARLNFLIDTVIGPIDDHDEDSPRIKWEIEYAKLTSAYVTTANQEIDAEIRKAQLTQGVGQTAQQLHLPR
jgi:hypothetical protein